MFIFSRYSMAGVAYLVCTGLTISGWPSSMYAKEKTLDFRDRGRPGRQTSGENRGTCPRTNLNLTALMPVANIGKTMQERPTFWVYLPYTSAAASKGEFSLQTEDYHDLYRTTFTIPAKPGFVAISLPATAAPLETNKSYRWYFKVYCRNPLSPQQELRPSPYFVQGWIERVPSISGETSYQFLAESGIWYDAIATLAQLRLQAPQDPELAKYWRTLLQAQGVNLEQLLQEDVEYFHGALTSSPP